MNRLPKFLEKYFWDIEFKNLDFDKRKVYILKRILDYGDEKAVAWMWKHFTKSEIKNVLLNFRDTLKKARIFGPSYWTYPKRRHYV